MMDHEEKQSHRLQRKGEPTVHSIKACILSAFFAAIVIMSLFIGLAGLGWSNHSAGAGGDLGDAFMAPGATDPVDPLEETLRNLPEALSLAGASSLAEAIKYSRDQALKQSNPMPLKIRQALEPYFSSHILDKARFTNDWNASNNITLHEILIAGDYALAVTLDNVIVFKKELYSNDLLLWIHELKHVEQYDELGVEGFARKYILDHEAMEREAYEYSIRVLRSITEKTRLALPQPVADSSRRTRQK